MGDRVIVLSKKESFIARVLIKKLQDAGVDCFYVPCTINDVNAAIGKAFLVVLCMGDDEKPDESLLHFLTESMEENDIRSILIGDVNEIHDVSEHIPSALVYSTHVRPVDNAAFVNDVTEYQRKAAAGEFKKSILIVDDDPSYLKLVREWLRDTYNVAMANSGLQAIKWLGKNKADLILLDHEMPVTSGPQVLEMLRSDPETRSIPVIFLTGKGDKQSVMAVVALKPEGYLLKTVTKKELMDKLAEFFLLHM